MEHTSAVELEHFPAVLTDGGTLAYGGSQDWYRDPWHRLAGCAATSGANLAAYYRVGVSPDAETDAGEAVYSLERFRALMDVMFGYMRPGVRGFPHADKYQEKFLAYAAANGARFTTGLVEGWADWREPFACLQDEIRAGRPVQLLILEHAARQIEDNTWHWMTVTGFDPETDELLISNYAKREWMPAPVVFDPAEENTVRLVLFQKS